jgi:hypothetical protein
MPNDHKSGPRRFAPSIPSAFAVVRLITRSNLVGCSTGMSPGFAPRRILSRLCRLWVKRATSMRSRRSRNVRYASNTDRIGASQQNIVSSTS